MKKLPMLIASALLMILLAPIGPADISASTIAPSSTSLSSDSMNQAKKVKTSERLTLTQFVTQVAKDCHMSRSEALEQLGFTDERYVKSLNEKTAFRILSQSLVIKNNNRSTVRFYCETTESGQFRAIKHLLQVGMISEKAKTAKRFSGTIYANLEDANRIYYIVNGDFFDQGTENFHAQATQIGLGKRTVVEVHQANKPYAYRYVEDDVTF